MVGRGRCAWAVWALVFAVGCGDDGGDDGAGTGSSGGTTTTTTSATTSTTSSGGSTTDVTTGGSTGGGSTGGMTDCRLPGDPNAARKLVISRPFTDNSQQNDEYEVLDLAASGELSFPNVRFAMGRSANTEIVFTPDGEVGLVAQDDGTVGVFRFDENGAPQVVDAGFSGAFYAGGLVMDPSGRRAWVLDIQFRESGGGIYELELDCDDGTPTDLGRVVESRLPYGFAPMSGGRALLGARDVLDVPPGGTEAFVLRWPDAPEVLASVDAFGDDDAIISAVAVTADERFGLLGDNAGFSPVPNRVAVVEIGDGTLTARQQLQIDDPFDIVTSPFDDAAIVVNGFGNAIFVTNYDPQGDPPFGMPRELEYTGGPPPLPANAVMIARGDLEGLVFVAENTGVRRIRFEGDGVVTDLGPTSAGDGVGAIVGAIGVQP